MEEFKESFDFDYEGDVYRAVVKGTFFQDNYDENMHHTSFEEIVVFDENGDEVEDEDVLEEVKFCFNERNQK